MGGDVTGMGEKVDGETSKKELDNAQNNRIIIG
jgi:hypothetical protein